MQAKLTSPPSIPFEEHTPVQGEGIAIVLPFFCTTLLLSLGTDHVSGILWPQILLFTTCFVAFIAAPRTALLCAISSSVCLVGASVLFAHLLGTPFGQTWLPLTHTQPLWLSQNSTIEPWLQPLLRPAIWESVALFFFGAWLANYLSQQRMLAFQRLRLTFYRERQQHHERHMEAEQRLRYSEQKLMDITNTLPGVVFEYILRKDGTQGFTFISEGAFDLYGYRSDQIVKHPELLWSLVLPSEVPSVRKALRSALVDHFPFRVDHRFRTPQGTFRTLRARGTPHVNADGDTVLRGILLDITAQKEAEEALRISEESFRRMFEDHSSMMLLLSPKTGQLLDANPAACHFYGYNHQKMTQKHISELNSLPKHELHERLREAAEKGRRYFQFPHRLSNGDIREVEVHTSKIPTLRGEILFSIIHDATERIQAQRALAKERELLAQRIEERTADLRLANENLERAARLKDQFLANISHELRTPLNAILSMTEVMLERLFGPINERQKGYLQLIQQSGKHLLSLITDLLDFSQLEAHFLRLESEPLSLEETCQSSIDIISQLAHKKGQSLDLDNQLPAHEQEIVADPRRLRQIMVNLLSNAVKFTPEQGKIGVTLSQPLDQDLVQITVWDTGIGIAEQDQELLFQPFVQIKGGLDRPHEGAGLGLALVEQLVHLHGGDITVESRGTRSQGAAFHIRLPKQPPIPHSAPSPSKTTTTPQTTLFFLSKPRREHADLIRLLSQHNFSTLMVPPGKQLEHLKKISPPQLLFLDARRHPEQLTQSLQQLQHTPQPIGLLFDPHQRELARNIQKDFPLLNLCPWFLQGSRYAQHQQLLCMLRTALSSQHSTTSPPQDDTAPLTTETTTSEGS